MAAIYLKHPIHGAKVATMEQEAVYDEGNGWVRFDPLDEVASPDVSDDGTRELRAQYEVKFGKRPYMGWDADTLREKLAA